MTKQITLDLILEQTRNARNRICVMGKAREEMRKHAVLPTIVTERGPAGGASVVRVSGPQHALESYVREFVAQDEEDAVFFIDQIVPYVGAVEQATHKSFPKAERQRRNP